MVKITNGVNVFEVTRGAFDGIYSRQGYTLIDEKTEDKNLETFTAPEKSEDEIFVEEILEKPISQWSKDEVKKFAALKDIDLSGTKNINEAKALIKDFMEANAEN